MLVVSLFSYHWIQAGWLQFGLLFLVPDLSMLGYLSNVRMGASAYNTVHSYVIPIALVAFALRTNHSTVLAVSLIWIAHIGFDRMLGYGLKYPTRFQDTHLNPARHTLEVGTPSLERSIGGY